MDYYHNVGIEGSGVLFHTLSNKEVAGILFTLSKDGYQIVFTFAGKPSSKLDLWMTAGTNGWPDSSYEAPLSEIVGSIKFSMKAGVPKSCKFDVDWRFVAGAQPSPLPKPGDKISGSLPKLVPFFP